VKPNNIDTAIPTAIANFVVVVEFKCNVKFDIVILNQYFFPINEHFF